jgi:hypothetical protein
MVLAYEVEVTTGWAVLGADDRVVVLLYGRDADEAAKDWSSDGYGILPVTDCR